MIRLSIAQFEDIFLVNLERQVNYAVLIVQTVMKLEQHKLATPGINYLQRYLHNSILL